MRKLKRRIYRAMATGWPGFTWRIMREQDGPTMMAVALANADDDGVVYEWER